jgi:hypothetical protein
MGLGKENNRSEFPNLILAFHNELLVKNYGEANPKALKKL